MIRLLIAFLLAFLATELLAAERVDAQLDAAANGEVSITVVRGHVRVVGWDKAVVDVEGTRDERSEEFVFTRDGDLIVIEDRLVQNVQGGTGSDFTIHVPVGSRVSTDLVSTDLDVRGIAGGMRLRTVSGDVEVREGTGGDLTARTVSGDITVEHRGGEVDLSTVSGDVQVHTNSERLEGESVSGDVIVTNDGAAVRGKLNSVSGDLQFTTALAGDAEVSLETTSGDVTLALKGDVDARVRASSHSGDIDNRLDSTPTKRQLPAGRRLETTVGSGRGLIELATLSGDIEIEAD